jgi:lipoprotein-anchoring transpeptidase ErfK/SrfK
MNRILVASACAAVLACSPPVAQNAQEQSARPEQTAEPTVLMSAEARAAMERVNAAAEIGTQQPRAAPAEGEAQPAPATLAYDPALVRTQVLLDRAHFSPGAIDGFDGANLRKAVTTYQEEFDLLVSGEADAQFLSQLSREDREPALISYVITRADVRGPFANVPRSFRAMARLRRLAYGSAAEAIAERYHMDERLLRALNPGVDFTREGVEIVVANAGGELEAPVDSIVVDKDKGAVFAFDEAGAVVAFYPATIGSGDAPTPSGEHHVQSVTFNPLYNYDPARLPSFRDRGPAVTIRPGPNNPVGLVWIALSVRSYGIHGTPEPHQIGRTQSHGCVRLTNWDAVELGRAVRRDAPVTFVGGESDVAQAETPGPAGSPAPDASGVDMDEV